MTMEATKTKTKTIQTDIRNNYVHNICTTDIFHTSFSITILYQFHYFCHLLSIFVTLLICGHMKSASVVNTPYFFEYYLKEY